MDVYDHMARALAFCRAANIEVRSIAPAPDWTGLRACVTVPAMELVRMVGRVELQPAYQGAEAFHGCTVYDGIEFWASADAHVWESAFLSHGAAGEGSPVGDQASGGGSTFGGAVVVGSPNEAE